jgi:hypothetical protein
MISLSSSNSYAAVGSDNQYKDLDCLEVNFQKFDEIQK